MSPKSNDIKQLSETLEQCLVVADQLNLSLVGVKIAEALDYLALVRVA